MTKGVRYHCTQCGIHGMDIRDAEYHRTGHPSHPIYSDDYEKAEKEPNQK